MGKLYILGGYLEETEDDSIYGEVIDCCNVYDPKENIFYSMQNQI